MLRNLFKIASLLTIAMTSVHGQHYYSLLITGGCPYSEGRRWNDSFWNDTYLMRYALTANGYNPDPSYMSVLYYDGFDCPNALPPYQATITTGAATIAAINNRLGYLASVMTNEDILFVWIFCHGGTNYSNSSSMILESSNEELWDTDFAAVLNTVPCRKRIIMMAGCYSGGFIDNLQSSKTIILTACAGGQMSLTCDNLSPDGTPPDPHKNEPYGRDTCFHSEFNYHVMNAMLESTVAYEHSVPSDADMNNGVSLDEVASWEMNHDSYLKNYNPPSYTPQISDLGSLRFSTYVNVGMDIAANSKSLSESAIAGNNQRKIVRDPSGKLHSVVESNGVIYYRSSTDGGSTWPVCSRLSSVGGGASAPCIALTGSSPLSLVVAYRHAGSGYDIPIYRSTTGGASWSNVSTISSISCSSPGPVPSVAGASTNAAFLSFATSNGLECRLSTNGGQTWPSISALGTAGSATSPSTGMNKFSTWYTTSVGHLAYANDIPANNPSILYAKYEYPAGTWAPQVNVSSIVPGNNLGHENPCLAVSSDDGYLTIHVAWDALDPNNPGAGHVILYRKRPGSTGVFENQIQQLDIKGSSGPALPASARTILGWYTKAKADPALCGRTTISCRGQTGDGAIPRR